MRESVPLATLLSHALVAFTIEFDNEAERRMPHRTTRHGVSRPNLPAPWLVSLAYVGELHAASARGGHSGG